MTAARPPAATTQRRDPRLIAAAFVLLWSTGYPAGKIGVAHAGPFTLLDLRFIGAALIFALLCWLGRVRWPCRRDILHSAVVGALSLTLQFGGVYAGLHLGASAGVAALVIGAMPLSTALLATLLGQRIRGLQWLGLALGFAGVLLVIGEGIRGGGSPMAYAALLVGLFGISAGTLYQNRYGSDIDPRAGLLVQHLAAVLLLAPLATWIDGWSMAPGLALYGALGWIILVNSVAGFGLLFLLLRQGEATQVAALFYLVPPVTAVMSSVMLHEPLTTIKLGGFALTAVGVYLGTHGRSPAPQASA